MQAHSVGNTLQAVITNCVMNHNIMNHLNFADIYMRLVSVPRGPDPSWACPSWACPSWAIGGLSATHMIPRGSDPSWAHKLI